jgi:hypothetical protein
MNYPTRMLSDWLTWLDSHDGLLHRRSKGGQENDHDVICTVPAPPGAHIMTVGDLRWVVGKLKEVSDV